MRVIAGDARRLLLKTLPGLETRPTTDRIKETLFNVIQDEVPGAYVLDLFAGSGAIGIEALSRGAEGCVFVDNNKAACRCIEENLAHTRLADRGRVILSDHLRFFSYLGKQRTFDLVFMDPPYGKGLEISALTSLIRSGAVDSNTLIAVEAAIDTDFSFTDELGFDLIKEKNYKTNKHVFLRMNERDS